MLNLKGYEDGAIPCPFGLTNATTTYASAHAEPSGRHQRFALDLFATTSTHTHADSSEEDEAWAGADFSKLHDPETMRRFLAVSDYCFGYSDSDDEGAYDPTRECFQVELGMPTWAMRMKGKVLAPCPPRGRAVPHVHASSLEQRGTRTFPPSNFDAWT